MKDIKSLENQRDSSIELLRIISMIMIVFHHFAVHGNFLYPKNDFSISYFWYNFIGMWGKVGVNLFVLISGYFLINSKAPIFNLKRILKFWGQVFFYSTSLYLIFGFFGLTNDFGIKVFIKRCLPIMFSSWWFATTYFVLYLIHPFFNKLLNNLDKKTYQNLLILLVVCFSIIPTLTNSIFQGNALLCFITLYAIAGYIRNYGFNKKFSSKHYFLLFFAMSLFTYVLTIKKHSITFISSEKLYILLISVSLFMLFTNLKMNYHKWINTIASATFGVYLIHDYYVVRPILWKNIFNNVQFQDSIMLIPYSIIVVLIVYITCTIIDLIRQKLLEKPYMNIVNKYHTSVFDFLNKYYNIGKNIVFGKEK